MTSNFGCFALPHVQSKRTFNLIIVAILLANTRKPLKFYHFESVQDLVSFINLDFFFLFVCPNLFLLLRLEFFLICS